MSRAKPTCLNCPEADSLVYGSLESLRSFLIHTYGSVKDAERELGVHEGAIQRRLIDRQPLRHRDFLSLIHNATDGRPQLALSEILGLQIPQSVDPAYCLQRFAPPFKGTSKLLESLAKVEVETSSSTQFEGLEAGVYPELHRLRVTDPKAARVRIASELPRATDSARAKPAALPTLLGLISLWVASLRASNNPSTAYRALIEAFRLSKALPPQHEVHTILKQNAIYLLTHQSLTHATAVAAQNTHLAALYASSRYGETLVDLGMVHSLEGQFQQARTYYLSSLDHLPAENWNSRCAALLSLAIDSLRLGDPETARHFSSRAIEQHPEDLISSLTPRLFWIEGLLAYLRQDFECALTLVTQAADAIGRYSAQEDVALATLQLVEIHLRLGNRAEAMTLVSSQLTRLISQASTTKHTRDLLLDFLTTFLSTPEPTPRIVLGAIRAIASKAATGLQPFHASLPR
ncbi:MAG: tetratricopeptide repeat protein [Acidobacteriota bacterium]